MYYYLIPDALDHSAQLLLVKFIGRKPSKNRRTVNFLYRDVKYKRRNEHGHDYC